LHVIITSTENRDLKIITRNHYSNRSVRSGVVITPEKYRNRMWHFGIK